MACIGASLLSNTGFTTGGFTTKTQRRGRVFSADDADDEKRFDLCVFLFIGVIRGSTWISLLFFVSFVSLW
jgi:hypothetical protein